MMIEIIEFEKGNPFLELKAYGVLHRKSNVIQIDNSLINYDRYLLSVRIGRILSLKEYDDRINIKNLRNITHTRSGVIDDFIIHKTVNVEKSFFRTLKDNLVTSEALLNRKFKGVAV